jgi:hypothetical protein
MTYVRRHIPEFGWEYMRRQTVYYRVSKMCHVRNEIENMFNLRYYRNVFAHSLAARKSTFLLIPYAYAERIWVSNEKYKIGNLEWI